MSARFGGYGSGNGGSAARALGRREGLPWMTDKQTEAYLIARDALRRIQRSSPLVVPALQRAEAPHSRARGAFGGQCDE